MPGITGVGVVGADGVLYIEERDVDSGTVIRRRRAQDDMQPARVRFERELEGRFADWQRWKITRQEAQSRGLPAAVINALTNREDAAWQDYGAALLEWRSL